MQLPTALRESGDENWRSWSKKIKGALDANPLEKQLLSFFTFGTVNKWYIQILASLALVCFFLVHRISVSKAQQLLTFENITLQWNALYLCLC